MCIGEAEVVVGVATLVEGKKPCIAASIGFICGGIGGAAEPARIKLAICCMAIICWKKLEFIGGIVLNGGVLRVAAF